MTNPRNVIAPEVMANEAYHLAHGIYKAWLADERCTRIPIAFFWAELAAKAVVALHRLPTQSEEEADESAFVDGYRQGKYDAIRDAQSPSEELLAAEAENNRLREVVDDMRIEVARITDNAATEIVNFRGALERIALLDEADGHELTTDHAFQAVVIATNTLGKHPSEIHAERYLPQSPPANPTSAEADETTQNDESGGFTEHALTAALNAITVLQNQVRVLEEAVKPFADCVYNDNGDVTFDKSLLTNDDYWRAYRAMRNLPPLAQSPLSQEGDDPCHGPEDTTCPSCGLGEPSQGGVTLRELGESYCKEQPAPGTEALSQGGEESPLVDCPECKGSGFSGQGTGYGDVCSYCGGTKQIFRIPSVPAPAKTKRDLALERIAYSMTRKFEDPASHANWCVTEGRWQPIKSVPKDGTRVLACAQFTADEYDENNRVIRKAVTERYPVVAYWLFGGLVEHPFRGSIPQNLVFTHWQPIDPLPEPPK